MNNKDQKKPEIPHRMNRLAFPKARYGVYLALIIILLVLCLCEMLPTSHVSRAAASFRLSFFFVPPLGNNHRDLTLVERTNSTSGSCLPSLIGTAPATFRTIGLVLFPELDEEK